MDYGYLVGLQRVADAMLVTIASEYEYKITTNQNFFLFVSTDSSPYININADLVPMPQQKKNKILYFNLSYLLFSASLHILCRDNPSIFF